MTSLIRYQRTDHAVFGRFILGRDVLCVTLEHPTLLIPTGTYRTILRWSWKAGMLVMGIEDVPGRTDIEGHIGNTMVDTKGCVLFGSRQVSDREVEQSRAAFGTVMQRWREWESKPIVVTEGA